MRKQPSERAQKHFSKIQWHSMEKARTCMNQHYIQIRYWLFIIGGPVGRWISRGQCVSITIRTMVWVDVFSHRRSKDDTTSFRNRANGVMTTFFWSRRLFQTFKTDWKAWQYTSWICGLCKKTKSLKMFYDSEESMIATTHLLVCLIGSNKGWIAQESTTKNMYLQLPSTWKHVRPESPQKIIKNRPWMTLAS